MYDKFTALDTEVIFITPDNAEETGKFLEAAKVTDPPFPILSDPGFKVLKKLMLFSEKQNFTTRSSEKGADLPNNGEAIPATFIIDKMGVLKFKYLPQYYSDRPPVDYILEILPKIVSK